MELQRGVNAKRLDGTATVTPYSGLGRYSFLDEISTAVVRRAMGGPSDQEFLAQFHRNLGEAITLAEALATVVDDVFSSLVVDESVRMEPSVLRVDRDGRRCQVGRSADRTRPSICGAEGLGGGR